MDKQLEEIEESISQQLGEGQTAANIAMLREQTAREEASTRSKLAFLFIVLYFALLFVIIIGVPIYNATIDNKSLWLNIKDLLQVYSSIVGPLAGFVIAYYFKNK